MEGSHPKLQSKSKNPPLCGFFNNILSLLSAIIAILFSIQTHAQRAPVPVFIYLVKPVAFVDALQALGTLKANQNVNLTSTTMEYITAIHFEDGQRVEKGALLVEMDAAEELARKREESARYKEAKRQVDRLSKLSGRGATSESALDEQQLELQTSEARIQVIESQIRQRRIEAPFDGVLGQRNISVGALAQPGMMITTLDDIELMKLDFTVPERFLSAIKTGASVIATTEVWPDTDFTAEVKSINTRIDPITRAVSVRALIKNSKHQLRPGMLMRVTLNSAQREALVVPEESILTQGKQHSVYLVEEDAQGTFVKRANVSLGSRKAGAVEILSGVQSGDRVITHGTLRVRPGSRVIIEAEDDSHESLSALLKQNTD